MEENEDVEDLLRLEQQCFLTVNIHRLHDITFYIDHTRNTQAAVHEFIENAWTELACNIM